MPGTSRDITRTVYGHCIGQQQQQQPVAWRGLGPQFRIQATIPFTDSYQSVYAQHAAALHSITTFSLKTASVPTVAGTCGEGEDARSRLSKEITPRATRLLGGGRSSSTSGGHGRRLVIFIFPFFLLVIFFILHLCGTAKSS